MKNKISSSKILSFNKFSVLENEELTEELGEFGSSNEIKISHKAFENKKTTMKTKKTKKNKKQENNVVELANLKSSEGTYPEVIRCKKCFKSHFPSRKVCKWNLPKAEKDKKLTNKVLDRKTIQLLKNYFDYLKTEKTFVRLRGGAGSVSSHSPSPLIITRAIESARKHGINFVRQVWVTELENESSNYPTLGAGNTNKKRYLQGSNIAQIELSSQN